MEERFDDVLCCDFKVPCNSTVPSTIWSGLGVENISGTLNIAFHCGCGGVMDVIVNGKKLISLLEGASFGATISDLRSIEVLCHGPSGQSSFCEGELKIVLHFNPFQNESHCIDLKKRIAFYPIDAGIRLILPRRVPSFAKNFDNKMIEKI